MVYSECQGLADDFIVAVTCFRIKNVAACGWYKISINTMRAFAFLF